MKLVVLFLLHSVFSLAREPFKELESSDFIVEGNYVTIRPGKYSICGPLDYYLPSDTDDLLVDLFGSEFHYDGRTQMWTLWSNIQCVKNGHFFPRGNVSIELKH